MSFKDLFSQQAKEYAKYRPTYPKELFSYLSSIVPDHEMVWDCGTGNGQAALALADYFSHIIATDPSQLQLQQAVKNPKVDYRICSAEKTDLVAHTISLITVAQAFHWFRQEEFFAEVKRVAKPGAVLAIWCYELTQINPEADSIVNHIYKDVLGEYWDPARKLVEEGYTKEIIPFQELPVPAFQLSAEWTVEDFLGYLSTWSALQSYKNKTGSNPLIDIEGSLRAAYGEGKQKVHWPLSIRVFKI
jgi:SAM-dependent methyltransferase